MASPEPNTKAPALAKNTPICVSSGQSIVPRIPLAAGIGAAATAFSPPWRSHLGGARHSQTRTPPARNSHATSDSVTTVTVASTR